MTAHRTASAALGLFSILLTAAVAAPAAETQPLHIICIGDSITQGGKAGRPEYTYRWPLAAMLKDAGVKFDFIGSRCKGLNEEAKWPDVRGEAFDADHEGYYGSKTAAVRDNLRETLPAIPAPDIALIHLGTNDQKAMDFTKAVVKPLKDIIGLLRKKNPNVVVLVGHLNLNDGSALQIRPLVEAMAAEMSTKKSPVVAVHHYNGWIEKPDAKGADTFDWVHPNPRGQRKMAKAWFEAMEPYLPGAPAVRQ